MLTRILVAVFVAHADAFYISHSFQFPAIPYSAGMYHIHSPAFFMEAHGFALPGFKIIETHAPKTTGDYVTTEFRYSTYFGKQSARLFSSHLNTSHVLLMDPDGVPCLLGKLTLEKFAKTGHRLNAHAELLRPSSLWERLLGGRRLVKESEVERSIKLGYSNYKTDLNLKLYVQMVFECSKKCGDRGWK